MFLYHHTLPLRHQIQVSRESRGRKIKISKRKKKVHVTEADNWKWVNIPYCPLFYYSTSGKGKRECSLCSELENYIKCRSENISYPVSYLSRDNSVMNNLSGIFPPSSPPHKYVSGLQVYHAIQSCIALFLCPLRAGLLILLLKCYNNRLFSVFHSVWSFRWEETFQ